MLTNRFFPVAGFGDLRREVDRLEALLRGANLPEIPRAEPAKRKRRAAVETIADARLT